MIKKVFFLLGFLLTITIPQTKAQNNNISFTHLSIKDGLSQNGVMTIYKDKKGFMWFGTRDGLNMYDGYKFVNFKNSTAKNNLSNHFINDICEDENGLLWVATNDGLNAYDATTKTFITYKNSPIDQTTISDNKILALYISSKKELWVGTQNGLNKFNPKTRTFKKFLFAKNSSDFLNTTKVNDITEDEEGNIWVGTEKRGLIKFTPKNENSIFIKTADNKNYTDSSISSIVFHKNGDLWIGTEGDGIIVIHKDKGVSHFKHRSNNPKTLSNNIVREILFDNNGQNAWIATYKGLNRYNLKKGVFTTFKNSPKNKNSISHNSIRSLYLSEGLLWAGTYFGGINLADLKAKRYIHYQHNYFDKESVSYNVVGPMLEDKKGNIWVGTEGGGLNYFDFKTKKFNRIKQIKGNNLNFRTVKSLLIDSKSNLWIGTHLQGAIKINLITGSQKIYLNTEKIIGNISDNSVTAINEDHEGNIWIGTESNLYKLPKNQRELTKIKLSKESTPITTIYQDHENNLWIGTKNDGLILMDADGFKNYINDPNNKKSLAHNSIFAIHEDAEKKLWIGTYGGGISIYDKKKNEFKNLTTADGLPNNVVFSITEDHKNNIWTSSPNGIAKYNKNEEFFSYLNYETGLPIEELNIKSNLSHSSGNLFFGGFNGLVSFSTQPAKAIKNQAKLYLSKLKLSNEEINPNDETGILTKPLSETAQIVFDYKQDIFSIEFIAINYNHLGKNQYAYMLEGVDKNWIYTESVRTATYTNLKAGDYTFKVKIADSNGQWDTEPVSLQIKKTPPLWETPLAYLIYLILVVVILYTIRKYFLIRYELENNLKLEKLEKKQVEELTKLKLKFFTNISHDFRTPLTLIHGPLQQLIEKATTKEENQHLLLIKKNVDFMLRLINQLMDFRKTETSTLSLKLSKRPILPFVKEIMYSFKEEAKSKDIKFLFISRAKEMEIYFDKNKIEKVIYNILSNAFKFTKNEGKITVEVDSLTRKKEIEYLEISIKNTGVGISKENIDKIFNRFYQDKNHTELEQLGTGIGLSLVKNLIEMHKGYVQVESEVNQYTKFTIGIPITDVYDEADKTTDEIPLANKSIELKQKETTTPTKTAPIDIKDKKRVLVVEDNADLRSFLKNTLGNEYNIIEAENGLEGIAKVEEQHPHIILSDIMMPEMNGLEMCEKLKSEKKTKHIPIILLTARTANAVELESLNTGANDFISKPFDINILKSKIHNLISSMDSIKKQSRKEVLLDDKEINNNSADEEFLTKLSDFIRDNITDPDLNVNKTGEQLGISRVHLYRKVKKITGQTPVEFIRNFRLSVAAQLLKQNKYNINEICYKVGFQDIGYFRKCFKKKYEISASEYIEKSKETSIND